jgi:hypothetical protein
MKHENIEAIFTIAQTSQKLVCENCKEEVNHLITIQAVKEKRWFLNITAYCWRCKTHQREIFESKK